MSFHKDLSRAKKDELRCAEYIESCATVESVRNTEDMTDYSVITSKERRAHQLQYGDLEVSLSDGTKSYVEVKSDRSAIKYKNLFLETLSDNGERTGNVTLGWFDNPDCQFDRYLFDLVGIGMLFVNRKDLKDFIESVRGELVTKAMNYNQSQANRSEGLVIKYQRIVDECPSAKLIKE